MKMIRTISLLALITFVFAGCKKDQSCTFDPCALVAPDAEIQAVKTYLANNNITATQHCSGLFYEIVSGGTGNTPTACGNVNATYVGKQTNGATFDQGTLDFSLSGVIMGWQIGIPLIKQGGRIRLYIPPSLGYGASQSGTLPPNSILIFDVTLNTVY